ncbi:hypothetical protein SAMN05216266_1107 [Amycolatopsis marina]|uniref:Uncharacterized protein n=1 Tax=Amycolatopsis marina TaxID=490629 RepID=A0A1I1ANP1_9PSEU|nr:hypothetical protein [Amycolatopsis marina]SFB39659.1 hypothetical protein SAMN05216266_1107 [Amycolatopsis marina]
MAEGPEWVTFTQVSGHTAAGKRVQVKTGVVMHDGGPRFAIAIGSTPPVIVDDENGKQLGVNTFVALHEKTKRARRP